MDEEEAKRRDAILRAYLQGRDWDGDPEFELKRRFVAGSRELVSDLPYVVDDEWDVSPGHANLGRGDLILTDGKGTFAAVEVKHIGGGGSWGSGKTARRARTRRRRKVEQQAQDYAAALRRRYPGAVRVRAYRFTNEGGLQEHKTPVGAAAETAD